MVNLLLLTFFICFSYYLYKDHFKKKHDDMPVSLGSAWEENASDVNVNVNDMSGVPDDAYAERLDPSRRSNFLVQHIIRYWNGEIDLYKSFGFYFFVPYSIFHLFLSDHKYAQGFYGPVESKMLAIVVFLVGAFIFAWLVWVFVGLNRSQKRHDKIFSKRKDFDAGGFLLLAMYLSFSFWSFAFEMMFSDASLVYQAASVSQTKETPIVRVEQGGKIIKLEGRITQSAVNTIRQQIHKYQNIEVLYLNSLNGDRDAAYKLAQLVTENDVMTYVEEICAGPCLIPFIAGKRRLASEDARFIFHYYFKDNIEAEQDAAFLSLHGVKISDASGMLAKKVPYILSKQFAQKSKIVAHWVTGADQIPRKKDLQEISHVFEKYINITPDFRALAKEDSVFRKKLERIGQAQRLNEISEAQYYLQVSTLFKTSLQKYLMHMTDQQVMDYTRAVYNRIDEANKNDPIQCYRHHFTDEVFEKTLSPNADLQFEKAMQDIIRKPGQLREVSKNVFQSLGKAKNKLRQKYGEGTLLFFGSDDVPAEKHSIMCGILLDYYRILVTLPKKEAVEAFYFLWVHDR